MKNYLKTTLWSMALILFTFMAVSCNDDEDDKAPSSKVYNLEAVGGSGVGGTVTFKEGTATTTTVVIELTGNPADSTHAAHIHNGVKGSGGTVAFPLTNVVNGKSTTIVDQKYSELTSFNGYVNIHASTMDRNRVVVADTNIGSNE